MTNFITITDTGKRRTSSGVSEETDIVNSGASLTLYGVEISVDYKTVLNNNPSLYRLSDNTDTGSEWTFGEVDANGIEQPKWSLRGVLNYKVSADRLNLGKLLQLAKTKGYKQLGGDLPDLADGSENSSKVNVHVESVKIIHNSNSSIINYTITMYETA